MLRIGEYITVVNKKPYYYFGQIKEFTAKDECKCLMTDKDGCYMEKYAKTEIRQYSLEEMVSDVFSFFEKEEPYFEDVKSLEFLQWLENEYKAQKKAIEEIRNAERIISDPEHDDLTSAELAEIEQLEEYGSAIYDLMERLKSCLGTTYQQIVKGDYVFTPIKNAFNEKTSYWLSKKGYTISVYAFTPWDKNSLEAMTTDKVLDSFIRFFEEKLQAASAPAVHHGLPVLKEEDDIRIHGIVYAHGDGSIGYWHGFHLTDEEESKVYEVLKEHDTEGCSLCGDSKDIGKYIMS